MPGSDDADLHLLAVGCIDSACGDRQDAESDRHAGRLEHIPTAKTRSVVHLCGSPSGERSILNPKISLFPPLYILLIEVLALRRICRREVYRLAIYKLPYFGDHDRSLADRG